MATHHIGVFLVGVCLFLIIFCSVDAEIEPIKNVLFFSETGVVSPRGDLCTEGEGIVVKPSTLDYNEECWWSVFVLMNLYNTNILRPINDLCKGRRRCLNPPNILPRPSSKCQRPHVLSVGYHCEPLVSADLQIASSNDDGCGFKCGFGASFALLLIALIALTAVSMKQIKKSRTATIGNGQADIHQENSQDYDGIYMDVIESPSACVSQDLFPSYRNLSETADNQHPTNHHDSSDDIQEDFHYYTEMCADFDGYELPDESGIYEEFPPVQNVSTLYDNNKSLQQNTYLELI